MDVNIAMRPEAVVIVPPDNRPETRNLSRSTLAKHAVLARLADVLAGAYGVDADSVLEGLEQREAMGSTGFGKGVAIPHCRIELVRRPTVAVLKLETPCDFGAADAMPVTLVFGLLSPENAGATHLHALAAISRLLRDDGKLQSLMNAPDAEALFALLTNQFLRDAA